MKETLSYNQIRTCRGAYNLFTWDIPVYFIDKNGMKHNIKSIEVEGFTDFSIVLKEDE